MLFFVLEQEISLPQVSERFMALVIQGMLPTVQVCFFMCLVPQTKYNIYIIHMYAVLAELCLLGNKTQYSLGIEG